MEGNQGFEQRHIIYQNESQDVLVYKVFQMQTKRLFARKEFICRDTESRNRMIREAENQINLAMASIVQIYSTHCWESNDLWHFAIDMEWLESDLSNLTEAKIKSESSWTERDLELFLWDIGSALAYMESCGIAHRDVKPQNLFLAGYRFKLGDFGFSKRLGPNQDLNTIEVGTLLYHSQQLRDAYASLLESGGSPYYQYDPYKEDVYSLALTALSMFSSGPENIDDESLFEPLRNTERLPIWIGEELRETLKSMLDEDSEKRPDSLQLKEHLIRMFQKLYGARVSELLWIVGEQIQNEWDDPAIYSNLEELLQCPIDLSVQIKSVTCLSCGQPVFPVFEICKIHPFCSISCYSSYKQELGMSSASTSCTICFSIMKGWEDCQQCQEEMIPVPGKQRGSSLQLNEPDNSCFNRGNKRQVSCDPESGSTPYFHPLMKPKIVCSKQPYRSPVKDRISSKPCYQQSIVPTSPQPDPQFQIGNCSNCGDRLFQENSYLFHCKKHRYCSPSCTKSFSTIMNHWKMCHLCPKNLHIRSLPFRGELRAAVFQGFEEFIFVFLGRDVRQVTASTKAMLPANVYPTIYKAKCHVCGTGIHFNQSWFLLICDQTLNYTCSESCLQTTCPKSRNPACSVCKKTIRNNPFLDLSDGRNAREWMGASLSRHCRLCYLDHGEVFLRCGHQYCKKCLIDLIDRYPGTKFHCVVCGYSEQVFSLSDIIPF